MESLAYLARQPILDRDGRIFAYELLFRDSPTSDTAIIASDVLATAQVLENVLNNIGLPKLIGDHKAFVNCSREMLLDNLFGLLNPRCFVLEVLEDVEVVTAIAAERRQDVDSIITNVSGTVADLSDAVKGNESTVSALASIAKSAASIKGIMSGDK